jgi:hypothetical protein
MGAEVENLTVPDAPPRKSDPEFIAATNRAAAAQEQIASAMAATTGYSGDPKRDRFERMIHAVLAGGVASTVFDVLKWAQELCDGIDRDYPPPA